jgi:hypothetical protein
MSGPSCVFSAGKGLDEDFIDVWAHASDPGDRPADFKNQWFDQG